MTEDLNHPIHEELKGIFREALRAKSAKARKRLRKQGLRRMMQAPPGCFWRGEAPQWDNDLLYLEASHRAWDYIERKINGEIRGKGTAAEKAYDPDKGGASPITLWNKYCKGEYRRFRQEHQASIHSHPRDARTGERLNLDEVAVPDGDIPRLELVREEFETDPTGELRRTYVRKSPPPPITAQAVLLKIYDCASCGEKWTLKTVAAAFDMPPGAMNSAWSRTLNPLLKRMGDRLRDRV
ncbi:hypothetical protein [Phormidium sp. CCY1219]|uniref:hypothetical protein n=1 Tax=Phormidium sp. CCY1219 TaxID=2886104 RepID=UPI002D1EBE3F|nr:hypothetical protein [Phormidium sp. CCY1219]MEB3828595.1 hypothetical protein [Phormidium sp. CCY1219]